MDAVTLNVVVEEMDAEVGRDAVKCVDPHRAKSGQSAEVSSNVAVAPILLTDTNASLMDAEEGRDAVKRADPC